MSREMQTLRKKKKEMLEISTVTEMKNASNRLVSRLNRAEDNQ